jgi:hypothetical protein
MSRDIPNIKINRKGIQHHVPLHDNSIIIATLRNLRPVYALKYDWY